MLGKLLNKIRPRAQNASPAKPAPAPIPTPTPAAADPAEWQARLHATQGDDALLELARKAPLHDIRHAAILRLRGEEILKQAEREFRGHDKRLHRAAKQAHDAIIQQREARTRATTLIDSAQGLTQDAVLPANRLVELDQAWSALDATLLDPAQQTRFADLRQQLTTLARERGERHRQIQQWTEQATQALDKLRAVIGSTNTANTAFVADAANAADTLDAARHAVDAALAESATLADPSCQSLADELRTTLQHAEHTTARHVEQTAKDAAAAVRQADREEHAKSRDKQRQQNAQATQQAYAAFDVILSVAEQTLAEGQLHEIDKQLATLREHADTLGGLDTPRQTRLQILQAEHARLKGWQTWGGEQAREELVREAEKLAGAAGNTRQKLDFKQHAHDIEQLRVRWRALGRDHLGNATSQTLWKRFDAALSAAWQPIATQQQKLAETRLENLHTRETLLAALEACPLPALPTTDPAGEQAGTSISEPMPEEQALARLPGQVSEEFDWRAVTRTLDAFQADWRKLGPIEHTAPRDAQPALKKRLSAALTRLETPLKNARHQAHAERRALITRATELQAHASSRDVVAQVRALQAEWQQHAKSTAQSQALARKDENALWAEFKTATDAIFTTRSAAHHARDAEFAVHQTTREALIARLHELAHNDALAPHEIKQQIGEIDAQWRNAGPAPKAAANQLDATFRTALAQAQQHASSGKQRLWQAACDSLLERLKLCDAEAAATATGNDTAARAARWAALPTLPTSLPSPWRDALQLRFTSAAINTATSDTAALDATLLKLEAALDIASPPAHQEARREIKLHAMKRALEARETHHSDDIDALIAVALVQAYSTPEQSQRLRTVFAARAQNP